MQRQVPQYIEVEDKIFGPFTVKQFSYLMGGVGLCVIIWRTVPLYIGVFLMGPAMGVSIALAYFKFNGKPFVETLRSFIAFLFKSKLYVWKNPAATLAETKQEIKERQDAEKLEASKHNLKDFSSEQIKSVADRLDHNN